MLAEAKARALAARQAYEALVNVIVAGAGVPVGAVWRMDLPRRTIIVSPPETAA